MRNKEQGGENGKGGSQRIEYQKWSGTTTQRSEEGQRLPETRGGQQEGRQKLEKTPGAKGIGKIQKTEDSKVSILKGNQTRKKQGKNFLGTLGKGKGLQQENIGHCTQSGVEGKRGDSGTPRYDTQSWNQFGEGLVKSKGRKNKGPGEIPPKKGDHLEKDARKEPPEHTHSNRKGEKQ